jgi:hypothetical protein
VRVNGILSNTGFLRDLPYVDLMKSIQGAFPKRTAFLSPASEGFKGMKPKRKTKALSLDL